MGQERYETPPIEHDLFSLLRSWGGEWMWEEIKVKGTLDSVITAIQEGRALWCTDGSFDRLALPDISSSGWIIFDPITQHYLFGNFYEHSGPAAGSFRGELLDLTALYLIAAAVIELYGPITKPNTMYCDTSCHRLRRLHIPLLPGRKHHSNSRGHQDSILNTSGHLQVLEEKDG